MIAVDTNLLVYAHREDSTWHDVARKLISEIAEGRSAWAIPWPCLHEFLAIVSHPKIYNPPTPMALALAQVDAWLEAPGLNVLAEIGDYWTELKSSIVNGRIAGPRVHDARIAALCNLHGVSELWTADRDFSRFPSLKVRNPLIG